MLFYENKMIRYFVVSIFIAVCSYAYYLYFRDYYSSPSAAIEGRKIMDELPFFPDDREMRIRREYCPLVSVAIEGFTRTMIVRMNNGNFDTSEHTIEFFDAAALAIREKGERYQDLSDNEIMTVIDEDWNEIYVTSVKLSNLYFAGRIDGKELKSRISDAHMRCVYGA